MKTLCCSFPGDRSAAMSNEHTPLITSGMCGLTVNAVTCGGSSPDVTPDSGPEPPNKSPRQLNTFFGVMVPTVLSMFSIVLFLRTGEKERKKKKKTTFVCVCVGRSHCPWWSLCAGFVVGHAGLLQGLLMVFVAYFIISLTILSICAISTNGAVQGGGAYCILPPAVCSRTRHVLS